MSIMDEQNGPPEPGKTEPSPEDLAFLKRIFRRVGIALGGLADPEIEGLVRQMELGSHTIKMMRGNRG